MSYSDFIQAVRDNTVQLQDVHFNEVFRVLVSYLTITMKASEDDAKDIAQQSILIVMDSIRNNKIKDENRFGGYIIRVCKNEYLRYIRKQYVARGTEQEYFELASPAQQLENILDDDRIKDVRACLDELPEAQRRYILYWFENPKIDGSAVADNFGISVSNAWIKKHRILKIIEKCLMKKKQKKM